MPKNTITRWLITRSSTNELTIKEKEVSPHAPVNKVLDRVDFYAYDVVPHGDFVYILTHEQDEHQPPFSKVLVAKMLREPFRMVDITEEDRDAVLEILSNPLS